MSITIRPDGSVTVDTASEAADVMRFLNGHGTPKPKREVEQTSTGEVNKDDARYLKELEARDMLKAAGYKQIHQTTLRVFMFLLEHHKVTWSPEEIKRRLRLTCSVQSVSHLMGDMEDRKAIVRVARGQYQVK